MFLVNFSLGSLIPVGSFIREARVVGSLYLSVCLNSQFHVSFQSAPWFEPIFKAIVRSCPSKLKQHFKFPANNFFYVEILAAFLLLLAVSITSTSSGNLVLMWE